MKKKKSASKTAAKTIAKPAFPAKELERWFRSEVNQLTETVVACRRTSSGSSRPRQSRSVVPAPPASSVPRPGPATPPVRLR